MHAGGGFPFAPARRDENVELMLAADAAKVLELSPDMVRSLARKGELPSLQTPGGVRIFKKRDVAALAARRRRERGARRAGISSPRTAVGWRLIPWERDGRGQEERTAPPLRAVLFLFPPRGRG